MEKTTKKRVKNVILGVTSAALVAGLTSALTLAMLSDVSSKENTFTASPNLSLTLHEPKWDGNDYTSPNEGDYPTDPNKNYNSVADGDKGVDAAKAYIPDTAINKNPFVVNDSQSSEYIAFAVTYQVKCSGSNPGRHPTDGTLCAGEDNWHTITADDFRQYFAKTSCDTVKPANEAGITEQYNDTEFDRESSDDGYMEYYYYKKNGAFTELKAGQASPELFKWVVPLQSLDALDEDPTGDKHMFGIKTELQCDHEIVNEGKNLTDVEGNHVFILVGNDAGLPEFRINVVAAAIQTDLGSGTDASTIETEIKKCFPAITNKDKMVTD